MRSTKGFLLLTTFQTAYETGRENTVYIYCTEMISFYYNNKPRRKTLKLNNVLHADYTHKETHHIHTYEYDTHNKNDHANNPSEWNKVV